MIISGVRVHTVVDLDPDRVGPFSRLRTGPVPTPSGTDLIDLEATGARAVVEWINPFSWDAGLRGVTVRTRELAPGTQIRLHAGPYATADAVAAAAGTTMRFPAGGDGHRYTDVEPPGPDDVDQDTAGWVVVELGGRCLVLAWAYSGAVTCRVERTDSGVRVTARLPLVTADPSTADPAADQPSGRPGPDVWLGVVDGGLDDGAAALRTLITDRFVRAPDLSGMPGRPAFPCLVANSWGVGEDTSTERILAMMDATAAVGAEVFVVDKGWERAVGDWHPNDRFPSGLAWLSDQARDRGMGFGVWCGFGNADPTAPVALSHPDWLARWRGVTRPLSFDNPGLCLGHDPARDWVLDELRRMVTEFRLTWLIHDFETIARCDRADHTHGAGDGDLAAEAAWHHILRTVSAEFPRLVLENCWNGGRPLDLAMVASHHTTITEDHCRVHWNALAKVALGRYLPLDWQSAYMGVDDLPPRARIAPYVIGGPWILMDDPATWDDETRAVLHRAAQVYTAWRGELRTARVSRPDVDRDGADAVQADLTDGRTILAVSLPPGPETVGVRPTGLRGAYTLTDEWTGARRTVQLDAGDPTHRGLVLPTESRGDGLLLSLTPTD